MPSLRNAQRGRPAAPRNAPEEGVVRASRWSRRSVVVPSSALPRGCYSRSRYGLEIWHRGGGGADDGEGSEEDGEDDESASAGEQSGSEDEDDGSQGDRDGPGSDDGDGGSERGEEEVGGSADEDDDDDHHHHHHPAREDGAGGPDGVTGPSPGADDGGGGDGSSGALVRRRRKRTGGRARLLRLVVGRGKKDRKGESAASPLGRRDARSRSPTPRRGTDAHAGEGARPAKRPRVNRRSSSPGPHAAAASPPAAAAAPRERRSGRGENAEGPSARIQAEGQRRVLEAQAKEIDCRTLRDNLDKSMEILQKEWLSGKAKMAMLRSLGLDDLAACLEPEAASGES